MVACYTVPQLWSQRQTHILLLTSLLPFPSYDDEVDKVNQYQRLSLEDLEKIEIGKCKHINPLPPSPCGGGLPFSSLETSDGYGCFHLVPCKDNSSDPKA